MAIKPVKPNEAGGISTKPIPVARPSTGLPPRPLIKANVRNAPRGGGEKIKAIRANGGLGGGNNLTPYAKRAIKGKRLTQPRVK